MIERARDTIETVHHDERLSVAAPVHVVDAETVDVDESIDRLAWRLALRTDEGTHRAQRSDSREHRPQCFHGDQIILTHMAETVEFRSNGNMASGYLAKPASGSGPGVLVIQEWWGLDSGIKEMADRLAQAGFVALAPDLYHGELAAHDEMDKASHLMQSLPPDRAGRDMSGAVDYLPTHPAVTSKGIGVVGFCMGGMLAFIIAANRGDKVTAVVPFYGFPQGSDRAGLVEADGRGERTHGGERQLLLAGGRARARSQAARHGEERHAHGSSRNWSRLHGTAQRAGDVQRGSRGQGMAAGGFVPQGKREVADSDPGGPSMVGAIDQGLSGIAAGFERLDKAAARVARDGAEGDLAGNMIDLMKARHQVRASVAVIRTADETIGTLLDVLA